MTKQNRSELPPTIFGSILQPLYSVSHKRHGFKMDDLIFRVNEDTSISQMMEFLTRKEMKAFLIGYIHGKNNIL